MRVSIAHSYLLRFVQKPWQFIGAWTLTTVIGWPLILIPASYTLSVIPYTLADFPIKVLPVAVMACGVTAAMALPGASVLILLQGRLLAALLGLNPIAWAARTSRGLLLGWAIGWGLAAVGLLATYETEIGETLVASGALLGMVVGSAVSINQQRLVNTTQVDARKWGIGNSGLWLLGGLLYWCIYQGLDGFMTTSVSLGEEAVIRPAQDGAYIWRAVIIGWVVVGGLIGIATSLLLNRRIAHRQK